MMNLSPHFTLEELTVSTEAARQGLHNVPQAAHIEALRGLCRDVLEPLREELGRPVVILSGYRSPAVNAAVGGARNSAHMLGLAADLIVPGVSPIEVCRAVVRLRLPYDQVIHEFGQWCHVSRAVDLAKPRKEELTARHTVAGTQYGAGLWA